MLYWMQSAGYRRIRSHSKPRCGRRPKRSKRQRAPRPRSSGRATPVKPLETAVFPELQTAIEELTSVLRHLGTVSEKAEEDPLAVDPLPSPPRNTTPRLARELRRLLQEIDTAR